MRREAAARMAAGEAALPGMAMIPAGASAHGRLRRNSAKGNQDAFTRR